MMPCVVILNGVKKLLEADKRQPALIAHSQRGDPSLHSGWHREWEIATATRATFPTTSRVYFYIPTNKEGYTLLRQKLPLRHSEGAQATVGIYHCWGIDCHGLWQNLAMTQTLRHTGQRHSITRVYFYIPTNNTFTGILLYTRRHGRDNIYDVILHLRGYTFMYPQEEKENKSWSSML